MHVMMFSILWLVCIAQALPLDLQGDAGPKALSRQKRSVSKHEDGVIADKEVRTIISAIVDAILDGDKKKRSEIPGELDSDADEPVDLHKRSQPLLDNAQMKAAMNMKNYQLNPAVMNMKQYPGSSAAAAAMNMKAYPASPAAAAMNMKGYPVYRASIPAYPSQETALPSYAAQDSGLPPYAEQSIPAYAPQINTFMADTPQARELQGDAAQEKNIQFETSPFVKSKQAELNAKILQENKFLLKEAQDKAKVLEHDDHLAEISQEKVVAFDGNLAKEQQVETLLGNETQVDIVQDSDLKNDSSSGLVDMRNETAGGQNATVHTKSELEHGTKSNKTSSDDQFAEEDDAESGAEEDEDEDEESAAGEDDEDDYDEDDDGSGSDGADSDDEDSDDESGNGEDADGEESESGDGEDADDEDDSESGDSDDSGSDEDSDDDSSESGDADDDSESSESDGNGDDKIDDKAIFGNDTNISASNSSELASNKSEADVVNITTPLQKRSEIIYDEETDVSPTKEFVDADSDDSETNEAESGNAEDGSNDDAKENESGSGSADDDARALDENKRSTDGEEERFRSNSDERDYAVQKRSTAADAWEGDKDELGSQKEATSSTQDVIAKRRSAAWDDGSGYGSGSGSSESTTEEEESGDETNESSEDSAATETEPSQGSLNEQVSNPAYERTVADTSSESSASGSSESNNDDDSGSASETETAAERRVDVLQKIVLDMAKAAVAGTRESTVAAYTSDSKSSDKLNAVEDADFLDQESRAIDKRSDEGASASGTKAQHSLRELVMSVLDNSDDSGTEGAMSERRTLDESKLQKKILKNLKSGSEDVPKSKIETEVKDFEGLSESLLQSRGLSAHKYSVIAKKLEKDLLKHLNIEKERSPAILADEQHLLEDVEKQYVAGTLRKAESEIKRFADVHADNLAAVRKHTLDVFNPIIEQLPLSASDADQVKHSVIDRVWARMVNETRKNPVALQKVKRSMDELQEMSEHS